MSGAVGTRGYPIECVGGVEIKTIIERNDWIHQTVRRLMKSGIVLTRAELNQAVFGPGIEREQVWCHRVIVECVVVLCLIPDRIISIMRIEWIWNGCEIFEIDDSREGIKGECVSAQVLRLAVKDEGIFSSE